MLDYKILGIALYSINEDDYCDDDFMYSRWNNHCEILESMGYDVNDGYVILHDDKFIDINTIDDSIQMLALKDGADLVQFSDGSVGFVGYYNGFKIQNNYFRILRRPTDNDIAIWDGNIDGELTE